MSSPDSEFTADPLELDLQDPMRHFREQFAFPHVPEERTPLYFAGHSLGLMPKKTPEFVVAELEHWRDAGVDGHFSSPRPWVPYHESVTSSFANLVGALDSEVVAMNSLTVNVHLLLVSFFRPTKSRFKILIENSPFPSDRYAVESQARFHGLDPREAIVEMTPRPGEDFLREEDILQKIEDLGETLSLVFFGNCNYLTGQCFNLEKITQKAHQVGAFAGFDLAHGVGNLLLRLHDWGVDFAAWCSYKFLNSGPGGVGGAFVHERHLGQKDLPRFEGWWGHNKATRFKMGPTFDPIPTAEAWQLSNAPILQMASLRASMEVFDQTTMSALRLKGDRLTHFLEREVRRQLQDSVHIVTPPFPARGSMICLRFKKSPRPWMDSLRKMGVFIDFREPDILRATPIPLYNSFSDVAKLVACIKEAM